MTKNNKMKFNALGNKNEIFQGNRQKVQENSKIIKKSF